MTKIHISEDEAYPVWQIDKFERFYSTEVEVTEEELKRIKRDLRAGERAQQRLHELAKEAGWS